ncbi:MAG: 4-hydroxyphenylacetate 3-hydroxylase family protein [Deltaproteobacteria bacterium]|nr:4-hydroxyphenylacetate 3-hydroxylase family protein [Deltaproteobacteria bacterium]
MIKTKEDYINSLKKLNAVVYYKGKRVKDVTTHPAFLPHINAAAKTYELALVPEYEDLLTATSHLTGKKINRFTHIHQSRDDLIKKVQMLRLISHETGSCYQRCVGFDAMNALYSVTFEIDEKHGTHYHRRFKNFLEYIQDSNHMVVGSMTDPKGDRSKAPSQQADPDLFTHVVKKDEKGVVIRGAKAHQTGAVNSHEMLILPTQALREEDKDYAISCAVPVNAPGVTMIFGRQTNEERKFEEGMDIGNPEFGLVGGEALVVLEDVFVPWDRVFMCGEVEFAGTLVERFATLHRQNYGGCKGGVCDVLVGACALASDYMGTSQASHVRDKLAEMTHLAETIYCGSLACSAMGHRTKAGSWMPDTLLANTTKLNVSKNIYEVARLAHDLAGGMLATMPFEEDWKNPETCKYVEKYLKGVNHVPTQDRIRIMRLIENMTSGTALVESMHGAGSPQAQKVMYMRSGNLEQKKKLAKKLAKIADKG